MAGIHERNFVKFENLCKYSKSAHSHTHSDGRTTTAHTVNSTQSAPLTSGHSGAPLTSRHSRTLNIHLNLHDKKNQNLVKPLWLWCKLFNERSTARPSWTSDYYYTPRRQLNNSQLLFKSLRLKYFRLQDSKYAKHASSITSLLHFTLLTHCLSPHNQTRSFINTICLRLKQQLTTATTDQASDTYNH